MNDNENCFAEAFNMLCGRKIGEGIHRQVFECKIMPHLVVKVENDVYRYFANVFEYKFWMDHEHYKKVADWLAPCTHMSPDARLVLQYRVDPLPLNYSLPAKMPAFLSDLKRENFGLFEGRLVCIDYAMTIPTPNTRLVKAQWT